ncbi:MAG: hypothetical protein IJU81_01295 [Bacteroidales bacterium]|nr:hypothetical protein [Bacteroidales bacterium]
MKQTCRNCKTVIEIDESEHKEGETVLVKCSVCGTMTEFNIPVSQPDDSKKSDNNGMAVIVSEGVPIAPNGKDKKNDNGKQKKGSVETKVNDKSHKPEVKEQSADSAMSGKGGWTLGEGKNSGHVPPRPPTPKNFLIVSIVITGLALIVGGFFLYKNVFLPRKIDAEAPRYYTIAEPYLALRSTPSAGGVYNKVDELYYGTELITYDVDSKWLKVKTEKTFDKKEQKSGYVAAEHALSKRDFFILNSIWGDYESKKVIETTKCRKAILNYYNKNGYIGSISKEELEAAEIGITPSPANQWQIFSKSPKSPNNTTYFKRLINPNSKFTDFAVIIQNINTGRRKLLYFYFLDDETPVLYRDIYAPRTGYIKQIKLLPNQELSVEYTP